MKLSFLKLHKCRLQIYIFEVVDALDYTWVPHRRRHSVVRDFTIAHLVPTIFYLERLYLQVMLITL